MVQMAYSIEDVADYFGVSTHTILEWLKTDPSFPRPFVKFETVRFRHSEIERYRLDNSVYPEEKSAGI